MPLFALERVRGIEPLSSAWKAEVMPLYDTRLSGCWELNPGRMLPKHTYYHYTTPRYLCGALKRAATVTHSSGAKGGDENIVFIDHAPMSLF
jgi:hypothetical protein